METLSAHTVPNLPVGEKRQYQNVKMSESGAASVALDAASNARRGNDADRATNGHDNPQQQQRQQNVQPEQSKLSQSRIDSQQTPGSTSAGFRSYASGGAPTSAPGSQDSTFSSGGGSVLGQGGRWTAGSSTLSVATSDTALTSPASASSQQQQQYPGRVDRLAQEWSPLKTTMAAPGRVERQRARTPEEQAMGNTGAEGREANTATSPLGVISPSTRHKRTASGLVKSASAISPVYGAGGSPGREKRAESVSSSGSRAGEVSTCLHTAVSSFEPQKDWT